MSSQIVKVDLHVHSKHSDSPQIWFLNQVNARECWTEPEDVYRSATARGMDLVTITDHDKIAGAMEIMHHGNVFLSEEVSARFPENGCIAHVLVYDITEAQHEEIQRLRYNIYDFVDYVRKEKICHSLAHPLSDVNYRLTTEIVEKMFLLFKNMELLNGPRGVHHAMLRKIVAALSRSRIEEWANKYDIEPVSWDPHRNWTGGSDDHSGHTIARCWTSFEGEMTVDALKQAINGGKTEVDGDIMSPEALAHTIYAGALNYFKENGYSAGSNLFGVVKAAYLAGGVPELEGSHLEHGLMPDLMAAFAEVAPHAMPPSLEEIFLEGNKEELHQRIYDFAGKMLNAVTKRVTGSMIDSFGRFRFSEVIHDLPKLLELGYVTLPYLIGFRFHYNDTRTAEKVVRGMNLIEMPPLEPRVAIFTDTIDSVNGVSLSLRRLSDQLNSEGHFVKILGLEGTHADAIVSEAAGEDHIVRFEPLHEFPLVAYNHMSLGIPPILAIVDYLVTNKVTLIQVSTPGPMGLAGMIIAKLLGIRVVGNYHTQIPEYAQQLTGDPTVGRIVRGYVRWFYGAMEHVIVATYATRDYLIDMGLRPSRLQVVRRGVDVSQFSPKLRSTKLWPGYGLNGSTKLLYVGRVSKEKNIDDLITVFHALRRAGSKVELAIVGDGPYREELQARESGSEGLVFTGFLEGEELAKAYASSDLFVFPSTTDTFGNAVLEAQASGLPAIVTDMGGPAELIEHNRTGLVVPAGDRAAMANAIRYLLDNAEERKRMSTAARRNAEGCSYRSAARALWSAYSSSHAAVN